MKMINAKERKGRPVTDEVMAEAVERGKKLRASYDRGAKIGNLVWDLKQGIIVHQVNAQGVMGGGIAKQIRDRWPKVFEDYAAVVPNRYDPNFGEGHMGKVIYTEVEPGLWVASIVGQQFYGRDPKKVYTSYEALARGFDSVAHFASGRGAEVHYPLIGCGLANGDWSIVSSIISRRLGTITHVLWELIPA